MKKHKITSYAFLAFLLVSCSSNPGVKEGKKFFEESHKDREFVLMVSFNKTDGKDLNTQYQIWYEAEMEYKKDAFISQNNYGTIKIFEQEPKDTVFTKHESFPRKKGDREKISGWIIFDKREKRLVVLEYKQNYVFETKTEVRK